MNIDKILRHAAGCGLTTVQLGKSLVEPPHNLTPADATKLMDQYRRDYPKAAFGTRAAEPAVKVARPAKTPAAPPPAAPPSSSLINRSAVKKLALEVSRDTRAGKFKRVSTEFLDGVEAALNGEIRDLGKGYGSRDSTAGKFVTGKALRDARDMLDRTVEAIVRSRVRSHPSTGVTLKD